MLMPQELKKHNFEHALRGYSTAEVDEYIDFICAKYEELYRTNADLERKLVAALRLVDEKLHRPDPAGEEEPDASQQAARILQEAERQKKRIVSDAEEYADRIIADADAHVARQAQVLEDMRQAVLAFRDDLYARYSSQIDQIEELAAAVQEGTINVAAPISGPSREPSLPSEEVYEEDASTAEPEEEPEKLLVFPLETDESAQDDGIDEEELAATDEALAFFEETEDAEENAPVSEFPAEEPLTEITDEDEPEEEDSADEDSFAEITDEDEPVEETPADEDSFVEIINEDEPVEEDSADEDSFTEITDEDEPEEKEELISFAEDLFPLTVSEDADSLASSPESEEDDADEYGDAVIEGGDPIGDDEDPLAGFDERIASLLGIPFSAVQDEKEESADEDAFSEEFLQITEEDETDGTPAAESDDELLRELRQAFNLQLETFDREDSDEKNPDGEKEKDNKEEEFSFLPETEEDDEPLSLFERLTGRTSENKKKDK